MEKKLYDLTAPQKSIWLTEQFYKGTNINNVCGVFLSSIPLDYSILEKTLKLVVKNNQSFRTKLTLIDGEVKQYFDDYSDFNINIIEISSDEELENLKNKINSKGFELLDSPLFEFTIYKFPNNIGGYILNSNHIISDSWTSGIIANEISKIYCALKSGKSFEKDSELSYSNYIKTEQEYINSEKFGKDKAYWDSIFETIPEIATIPSLNQTASSDTSFKAKRFYGDLSLNKLEKLKEYSTKNKVSLYNLFMGIFALYLGRVSNLDNFVIGTPILNRTNFKEKQTTGMFINVLPLKFDINHEQQFNEFISKIAKDSMGLLRHQRYSYNYILEDLRKKDSSLPGLYNVLLSYQITKMNENNDEIPHQASWIFNKSIANDLEIHIFEWNDNNSLQIAYDYKIDKYSEEEISMIHERILHVIDQILNNENILLKEIEIVTNEEKHKILYEFNNTKADYPKDKTISQLFEEQVEKTPDNIALIFEDQKLTYRELNEKANQLANYLRKNNIGRHDIVGIMVNRSLEMIVAILGVLKSGACYIPIDPEYPQDRIEYMLHNSNAKTLLTFEKLKYKITFNNKIFIELKNSNIYSLKNKNLQTINKPDDLAYIIYTSGTTGNPKGVMISHSNINNFIHAMSNNINFSSDKVIVSVTTISFDIFVLESLLPLLIGLQIIIANEKEQVNVELFNKLCLKNNVNIIQTTPSRFQILTSDKKNIEYFKNITDLLVGGEQFPKYLLKKLKNISHSNIYNVYGPTETTVWSTFKNLTNQDNINIGLPISNTTCYIFDKNQNLLPPYTIGTLYIGGDGVSKGYLNNYELTNKNFIFDHYFNNKIYNTGDLAYFNSKGELILIGRTDFQVKINGYRIELEEIENEILKNKNINNCVIIKKTINNHDYLCAYYTASNEIEISSIRERLNKKLPNYMVPHYFTELPSLPYTPNGKIDRRALPTPEINKTKEILKSRNDFDKYLINTLSSLLNINDSNISIDDNFFDLGGDSLNAINLSTKIYSKFNIEIFVKDILEFPIISDLSDLISSKISNTTSTSIIKVTKADYYNISSAQKNIYLASELGGKNSLIYNIPGGIIFDKMPDIKKLENCFNILIQRHESFRTYFEAENENIVQKILDKIDFKIDISKKLISENDLDDEFKQFVKPFDLSKAPLLRSKLIKLDNKKAALFVDMHHIISDGTSLSIFIDELCKLYNNQTLDEIKFTYKDFASFENKQLASSKFEEAEKYWVNQFKNDIPVLNMPTNYSRPAIKSYEGAKVYSKIDNKTLEKINKICKENSITPYMLLLSVYYILLSKYTSQDDIVIGSPIVGRNYSDLYNIIGMFVNTLPVRAKIDSSLSFKEFLNNIKNICLENYKYQDYPLNELISKLNISRDTSRAPLFDTLFTYQNNGLSNINFDGINSKIYVPDTKISKFDLSLEIVPENDILNLNFEYCTKLFTKQFIETFANHYKNILNTVLNNLDVQISSICMLSGTELNKIIYEFNNTKIDYPKNKTISELFEEQVRKTPNNIAVIFEDKKLTYKQLNEKANSLANYLINQKIGKNKPIAVILNRSIDLIVSMLAIIKSGNIYMPISTEFPMERINYILENSKTNFIITNSEITLNTVRNLKNIYIDKIKLNKKNNKNINNNININSGLYIIYTSGSTGNPKGVEISHKNLNNFIHSFNLLYENISNTDKLLASTNICFDVSIFEFFISLLNGVTLYLYTENTITDIFKYCETIIKNNITMLYLPPNILNNVYEILIKNNYSKLNKLLLGVEPINSNIIKKYYNLNPNMKIINAYGPTETTICATAVEVSNKLLSNYKIIPIGKPLNNLTLYILDKNYNPVPINVPGELYIVGDNVSNGYYLDETRSKKSFIKLPFSKSITYKTGDIVKWNEDGNISFIGRKDSQVKLNGHRIELGEIESYLYSYPNIDKCVVFIKDNKLIAYFTASSSININDLKSYLRTKLPNYFIPNVLMQLKKFKLTTNGKIDKKYLENIKYNIKTEYIPPKTDSEKKLTKIFEEVLNIEKISITDNFFELGGDSLSAIKLQIAAFNNNINISYKDIFDFPTIKQLAQKQNSLETLSLNDNYDYTEINKFLNNMDINKIQKEKFKNILITGGTGFLGSHIIEYILRKTKCNIYCLVRNKKDTDPTTRLLNILHFYFGNKYDKYLYKRLFIIEGDISKKNLGMGNLDISIDCIINSAAIVKHYGTSDIFNKTNIQGTQNIIDYSLKNNCKLVHISTLSVSGNIFEDTKYVVSKVEKGTIFSEKNLFINQDLSNVYIYSKFVAERLILENIINNNLNAQIIRLGNITNRYSDGLFQKNISENAFLNRIKSFIEIGLIPDYLKNGYCEFTPVDLCAEAISKLSFTNTKLKVFNLFNNNHISFENLILLFNKFNINISFSNKKNFDKKISELLNSSSNNLSGIINDFDENKNLVYDNNIKFKNTLTNDLLKKLLFKWPKIDYKYIKKYILFLKSIGYIK